MEHVVEAGRAPYLGRRQVEQLGHMLDPVGAQVAVLFLQEVQHRDQSGTLVRVQGDQLSRSHQVVLVQPGHVY